MAAHRTAEPLSVEAAEPDPEWRRLADAHGAGTGRRLRPPSVRRVVSRFVVLNLLAVALLLAGSIWASYEAASKVSLADAGTVTDLVAGSLVEPNLLDGVLEGDPAALDRLDRVVRDQLRDAGVVRLKIWDADRTIVYSDERQLVGRVFPQGPEELEVLRNGGNSAELSDLNEKENVFERSEGRLLEVYRRISTPSGEPLLLETYFPYDLVTGHQIEIWSIFAPISVAVLLLLLSMQVPLARRMIRQVRKGDEERLLLHARAADASNEERRRIAGSLHDGIVQDLAAAALVMTHAGDRLAARPATQTEHQEVARELHTATSAVRQSLTSLRSLLIEIYPPHLAKAGLASALADLVTRLQARGVRARLEIADDLDPPPEIARVVFRIAQETLLNIAKHARATSAEVVVSAHRSFLTMEIRDDGVGFDPCQAAAAGHFGLQVLADLAAGAGGTLDLATAPGRGTALRLRVPCPKRRSRTDPILPQTQLRSAATLA